MKFTSFTFKVTDDCNFRCQYCQQKKEKIYLDISSIENAIAFFYPFLKEKCYINFYGGEPLLAFEQIAKVVECLQDKDKRKKKQFNYIISTNGSLINDAVLQFLKHYKFSLLLSFDGFAQDISRNKGSFEQIVSIIKRLLENADIDLTINSVFTPETVGYLSKSMQFIVELGVSNIDLSLSTIPQWDHYALLQLNEELALLRSFILSFFSRTGTIPLNYLKGNPSKETFHCIAGKDRMTLSPDGKLWGCQLFSNYFKGKESTREYQKYCFGDLDSFIKSHRRIYPDVLANYSDLRMDYFYTSDIYCMLCTELEECRVCPVYSAFSTSKMKEVPVWTCDIKKNFRKERELFWKELT